MVYVLLFGVIFLLACCEAGSYPSTVSIPDAKFPVRVDPQVLADPHFGPAIVNAVNEAETELAARANISKLQSIYYARDLG